MKVLSGVNLPLHCSWQGKNIRDSPKTSIDEIFAGKIHRSIPVSHCPVLFCHDIQLNSTYYGQCYIKSCGNVTQVQMFAERYFFVLFIFFAGRKTVHNNERNTNTLQV